MTWMVSSGDFITFTTFKIKSSRTSVIYSTLWWWNMWVSAETLIFGSYMLAVFSQDVWCHVASAILWNLKMRPQKLAASRRKVPLDNFRFRFEFKIACSQWWVCLCEDRAAFCVCISTQSVCMTQNLDTPMNVFLGVMVTHQVGSEMRAAVLHLLSKTLFAPPSAFSSPHPSSALIRRQQMRKKGRREKRRKTERTRGRKKGNKDGRG